MGNLQAMAYAEVAAEGIVPLRMALSAHLTSNFYPPLPVGYLEPLMEALENVGQDDPYSYVRLPDDLEILPRNAHKDDDGWSVQAAELVSCCRAGAFINFFEDN